MNYNVPPKKTRTMAGVTWAEQKAWGEQSRAALIRALAESPGATVRELCVKIGKASPSTVQHHLYKLEDEGKIIREECPLCRARIWRVA